MTFGGCISEPTPADHGNVRRASGETAPDGLTPHAWQHIQDHIRRDLYTFEHVEKSADGGQDVFVADNPVHKLRGVFDRQRLVVEPSGAEASGWSVAFDFAGWGRQGRRVDSMHATRQLSKGRLEYRRGDIVEWYVHDERGIEQGFDVLKKPDGDGPLRIDIELGGTLRPKPAGEDAVNLLSKTGEHVLRYGGLVVYDADGAEVDAQFEVADNSIGIVVDDRQAKYPLVVDPWIEHKKLLAFDGAAEDRLGISVAVSGTVALVGSYLDDDNGSNSGSAYIFSKDEGGADNWGLVKKLLPADGATYDSFGISVSLDGPTALVGAYRNNDNGTYSGSAYIFAKDQGGIDNWGEVTKLLPTDGAADDNFGISVAISGTVALVGAHLDDDNGTDSGSAYVFSKDQGGTDNWGEVTKLLSADGAAGDYFGKDVSISGNVALVSALFDDDNGQNSGSAYIFTKDQGGIDNWGQLKKLVPADGAPGDRFSIAVAISGTVAVVGAHVDDDNGDASGSAYVFAKDQGGTDNWGEVKKLLPADGAAGDRFGRAVAIDGTVALVSAAQDDDNGTDAGSAYVFSKDQGGTDNWGEVTKLLPTNGAAGDRFGTSVSLSGDVAVIGAPYDADNGSGSGSSTVFLFNQPPQAADDTATTTEDTAITIDVLANDSDPEGDALTVDSIIQPGNGSVTNNGTDVSYTPSPGFTGTDSFTYTVSDGNAGTDSATVAMTVDPPPLPCDNVSCANGELCYQGTCFQTCTDDIDCSNPNHACYDQRCASAPCDGVQCATGEACYQGTCFESCTDDIDCSNPSHACYDQRCASAPCDGVQCASWEACYEGTCFESCTSSADCSDPSHACYDQRCTADPCEGVQCTTGEACYQGTCFETCTDVDDCSDPSHACYEKRCAATPCEGVQCATAQVCSDGVCASQDDADTGADVEPDVGMSDIGMSDIGRGDLDQPMGTGGGCACRTLPADAPARRSVLWVLAAALLAGTGLRRWTTNGLTA